LAGAGDTTAQALAPIPTPWTPTTETPSQPSASAALTATPESARLLDALAVLRNNIQAVPLTLTTPGVTEARADRDAAVQQLDDYLLPRMRAEQAPLLVVVGGSTGSGKSTLVNSIIGEKVTTPGVLRPTTRSPVLIHHPDDARWFTDERNLGASLVANEALPTGLALLDAPDIDSIEQGNRDLAAQLLAAADLWLFVTTAARYADAVPWDMLRIAAARHAQVALVLDRVDFDDADGATAVTDDLKRLMKDEGLTDSPLFVVPETPLPAGFLLPEASIAEISQWLTHLGGDPAARQHVIASTRDGVVDDVIARARELASAADEQQAALDRLQRFVTSAYATATKRVDSAASDGELLRGEVLARWQDFVGTSEIFRKVERGAGRIRDSITGFIKGTPAHVPQVEQAVTRGLEAVIIDAAEDATSQAHEAWRADPAGAALLDGLELTRTSLELRTDAAELVRAWQGDVLDLVRSQGESKRGKARVLSYGVNAVGLCLVIVVFASTGGLTGAEVGIAGGTAVAAQKLLEAVFGDDAVRKLATEAKAALVKRAATLMEEQSRKYLDVLDDAAPSDWAAAPLRVSADEVQAASSAERFSRSASAQHGIPADAAQSTGNLRGANYVPPPPALPDGDGEVLSEEADTASSRGTDDGDAAASPPAPAKWWQWRKKIKEARS
jgi:GTPase SAR1 family protein